VELQLNAHAHLAFVNNLFHVCQMCFNRFDIFCAGVLSRQPRHSRFDHKPRFDKRRLKLFQRESVQPQRIGFDSGVLRDECAAPAYHFQNVARH